MLKNKFIALFLWFSATVVAQQTMSDRFMLLFNNQLTVFPQEKIYLHTDKPYYLSGERIWFRAHVADAANHIPAIASRYVYVELIHPLDTVLTRVKILQDEAEAYHGYLPIPDDAPEGDYVIRAYTAYMRNLEEDYFCTKTVRIGDPQARAIHTDTKFVFDPERRGRIHATFRFSQVGSGTPLVPKSVKVSVNNGREMNIKAEADGTASFNFDIQTPSNSPKGGGQSPSFGWVRGGVILLEVTAFEYPYRQFIRVPVPDDDFDVSFYPEGGSLMQGVFGKIAFKAMKSNGQAIDMSGTVYDRDGTEITTFNSEHLGMGSFGFLAEKGKTYYAVCENEKGQSKRFNLPATVDHGYSLAVGLTKDNVNVTALRPADTVQNGSFYLLAHTRGLVHFVEPLNHERTLNFRQDQFPSGVLHFVLFDAGLHPVSERLVFINNQDDQAQVTYRPDQENFVRRSLVKNQVMLTDIDGQPLSGSFSVAVTSDREVMPDSTSGILTQLLLASDLRGHIENPAYYFQNTNASAHMLDLLMLTQGRRRYNIAELAQGRFAKPTIPVEIFPEISGTVKGITLRRPVENIDVTLITVEGEYFDNTQTDKDGRFYFRGGEFQENTELIVHAVRRRGMASMELTIDEETFPERTLSAVPATEIDRNRFVRYADKAEQMYIDENGVRMYYLPELTITAQRKPPIQSIYYNEPDHTITQEEIERYPPYSIFDHLSQIAGVMVTNNQVVIRGVGTSGDSRPLLMLDDTVWEWENIDALSMSDIAQIDVIKSANMFGMRGANGAIIIHTRRGEIIIDNPMLFHIKHIQPLGYQQPVEFYAPKYDTPTARNAQTPDLRTTIHWQPVVQTDDTGSASFEFYTADEPTSYTVVIEGITDDGMVIRREEQLWRRE